MWLKTPPGSLAPREAKRPKVKEGARHSSERTGHSHTPSSQWWAQLPGPHIQEGGGSGYARGGWGSALLEEGIYEE